MGGIPGIYNVCVFYSSHCSLFTQGQGLITCLVLMATSILSDTSKPWHCDSYEYIYSPLYSTPQQATGNITWRGLI